MTPLGLATSYHLTGPIGIALDATGDLYLTDADQVLRVDHATGEIGVVAGRGQATYHHTFGGDGALATRAQLLAPSDVTVSANGDVYVLDGNDRIRKVSAATGIITTVAGKGRVGFTGDGGPAARAELDLNRTSFGSAIAVAPNGDLYIADGGNNRIRKVSAATGIITTVAGNGHAGARGDGGQATRAELNEQAGIAFDSHADLFVAAGRRIREIKSSTGVISTVFGPVSYGNSANDLALGPEGVLYFSDLYGRQVLSLRPGTKRVSVVAGTGMQTIQAPGATAGDGGPATEASFGLTAGVTVDANGNLYIADFFNNSVRFIDHATGVISTIAGQIPQSPAHCC